MYEFEVRTGKITISDEKCLDCESKACIQACKKYGREILEIRDGKCMLVSENANERCTECLGCEYECRTRGEGAIKIELPISGLKEYRSKVGIA